MPVPFFEATRAFVDQNTSLYDFVHSARCSFWNTRVGVAGFAAAYPEAKHEDLQARFVNGGAIHGVNVGRAFLDHGPEFEEGVLSKLVLLTVTSMYEGFVASLSSDFPSPKGRSKALQFPSNGVAGQTSPGIREAIATTANGSVAMSTSFLPVLRQSPRYSLNKLDSQLTLFRYFKEIRNCITHSGGVGTAKAERAFQNVRSIGRADLGTRAVPEILLISKGSPVEVTLRGAVGFSEVVLRIVTTLDAELAATKVAEIKFLRRWRRLYPHRQILSHHRDKRERRLRYLVRSLGMPDPDSTEEIDKLLKARRLLF